MGEGHPALDHEAGGRALAGRGAQDLVGPPRGYYQTDDAAAQGFDFWKAFRTLSRRRWLILGVVVAGVAAATALTLRVTPLYKATATIEIQRQETQIIRNASVDPVEVADADFMGTQYALLKSRALAERVAQTLNLAREPRYGGAGGTREARLNRAAAVVQKNIQVAPVARSRVIGITYVSPSREESARIANAIAENFIESNLERKYNASAYARNFLEERLASTKEALEKSERDLVDYARTHALLDLGGADPSAVGESLDASAIKVLSAALTDAQNARINAEQKYIEARSNPATLQTLSSETILALKQRRSTLAGEYQEKLGRFRAEYPAMVELKARIDALDAEISGEQQAIVRALEAEYAAATARERSLKDRVTALSGSLQDERDVRIQYNILKREVETNRSQYEALLQRLKEVSISSGVTTSQVAIVDRAQAPSAPFSPNLRANLLRALILSLVIALALAFLLDYIDDTIKTPEDVNEKLGLPTIGVVPKLPAGDTFAEEISDPKSYLSEAYASARTSLQFSTASGAPRSILVTGTRPGEGKSSSVLGVGVSFAGTGRRVLIIDADMRKPTFSAPNAESAGLSGLLTGAGIGSLAHHVIPGSVPNLYLLPCGPTPPNPAELLSSPLLERVIHDAMAQFDLVLVDSPPVLTFADAPMLASVCDATMLIVQAGVLRRPAIQRTINRLLVARAHFVGALVTKFDVKQESYGYGYGYGYGYKEAYAQPDPESGGYRRNRKNADAASRRRIDVFASRGGRDAG